MSAARVLPISGSEVRNPSEPVVTLSADQRRMLQFAERMEAWYNAEYAKLRTGEPRLPDDARQSLTIMASAARRFVAATLTTGEGR